MFNGSMRPQAALYTIAVMAALLGSEVVAAEHDGAPASAAAQSQLRSQSPSESKSPSPSPSQSLSPSQSSSQANSAPRAGTTPLQKDDVTTRPPWLPAVFWYDVDPDGWSPAEVARILHDAGSAAPDAQYAMAVLVEDGRHVQQDLPQAQRRYRAAAEQGHAGARASLARMLLNGWGGAKDPVEARLWNARAAEQGQRRALFNAAQLSRGEPGGLRDRAGELALIVQAATAGLPQAALEAARRLRHAKSPDDRAQAWAWLLRAADASFPPALMELDRWCNDDPDVPVCAVRAGDALLNAAKAGYPPAQRWLGLRYWDSRSPPTTWSYAMWKQIYDRDPDNPVLSNNRPEGARWLTRAAQNGDGLALYNLGVLATEQKERAPYFKAEYRALPIDAVRSCYFFAAQTEQIPEAMMGLVLTYRDTGEDDRFTAAERETLTNYWVGKVGELGAFDSRDAWRMMYSDWRSHVGTPEPAFLRRGISGRETCRLDPLPGAALDDR